MVMGKSPERLNLRLQQKLFEIIWGMETTDLEASTDVIWVWTTSLEEKENLYQIPQPYLAKSYFIIKVQIPIN